MNLNLPHNELYPHLMNQPLKQLLELKTGSYSGTFPNKEGIKVINQVLEQLDLFESNNLLNISQKTIEQAHELILNKVFEDELVNVSEKDQKQVLEEFSLIAHEYILTSHKITLNDLVELNNGDKQIAIKIVNNLFP